MNAATMISVVLSLVSLRDASRFRDRCVEVRVDEDWVAFVNVSAKRRLTSKKNVVAAGTMRVELRGVPMALFGVDGMCLFLGIGKEKQFQHAVLDAVSRKTRPHAA